jgi:hypothetical protein
MGTKGLMIIDLASGIMDDEGNPLAGGKVYFYEAGTTTPQSVYLDRDKTTAASNPVVLDIYGRAEIYADGIYKVVVTDSDDSSVWDIDNVEMIPIGGTDFDGIDIGQTTPGKVKATELEFTTSITDTAGNSYTNLATEIADKNIVVGQTFDTGIAVGNLVKFTNSNQWEKATASDGSALKGVVTDISDNKVVLSGLATGLSGLTIGSDYYVQSDSTLGTTKTNIFVGVAQSTTELLVDINYEPQDYDIYNFFIPAPYEQTADDYDDNIRKQILYRTGDIVSIKAYWGAVRTGSPTGANEIDIINNGTQVLGDSSTDDTYDNLIATSAEEITSFASGTAVTAGNYLGVHIDDLREGGSGEQTDLLIQVKVQVDL